MAALCKCNAVLADVLILVAVLNQSCSAAREHQRKSVAG